MNTWQPIETADRGPDRKAILGWFPAIKCTFTIFWDKHDQRWTYFGGHGQVLEAPTHWMPMPAPPDLS